MDTIVATPIGNGLWAIECSVHGPLGIVTEALCDLLSRDHLASHT
jgi:hypothetical protein